MIGGLLLKYCVYCFIIYDNDVDDDKNFGDDDYDDDDDHDNDVI